MNINLCYKNFESENISYTEQQKELQIKIGTDVIRVKKSKNANYEFKKNNNKLDLLILPNLELGQNNVDDLLYSQIIQCKKKIMNETKENMKNVKHIGYDEIDAVVTNLPTYYYCPFEMISSGDNIIITKKNNLIEIMSKDKIFNNLEKTKQMGIIVIDDSKMWLNNIMRSKKKKILISDYKYELFDNLTLLKPNKLYFDNVNSDDVIIVDSEGMKLCKIKSILSKITKNKNYFILKMSSEINPYVYSELFPFLLEKQTTVNIVTDKIDFNFSPFVFKPKNNLSVNDLVKISRKTYNLSDKEKKLVEQLKEHNKYVNHMDILDSLSLSFYKNLQNVDNNICSICTETMGNNTCETECLHRFCLSCLGTSLQTLKSCPLCRQRINLNKLKTLNFDGYSKIKSFENDIDQMWKEKSKNAHIVLYTNNNSINKFISDRIKDKYKTIYINGNSVSKLKKIETLNKSADTIIIMNSNDYNLSKYIRNIEFVIILDNDYNYVTNKEILGYSCLNDRKTVNIIIYEVI
ncbi:RING finger domain protein [Catovirus CTV1]|uniref:RING finger domain protein n=1 Tax=Catovirus CTV1 TaxID=1977631 RepID=A0A1V0SC44_9VIRU|nr:RING finger domain protein [Catovirus CTV1]